MIDQIINCELRKQLKQNGYLCIDELFDEVSFSIINEAVINLWEQQQGWRTRVGHNGKKFNTELLTLSKREKVYNKIHQAPIPADRFSFIYHFVDQNHNMLVNQIAEHAIARWFSFLGLSETKFRQSFSLTSFNRYCFIDNHNDHTNSTQLEPYKITIIVYFGDLQTSTYQSKLVFDYKGRVQKIAPKPNRSVIFFPSVHTTHRVEVHQSKNDEPRLALSGWLL
ncbi:hypothetical protein JCM19233_4844 [Vibrio astriarenae]|nr:hypothetical protein JCM19233_4844 [Vibrio sp. C7]